MPRVVTVFVMLVMGGLGLWGLWSWMAPSEEEQALDAERTAAGNSRVDSNFRKVPDYKIQIIVDDKEQPLVEYEGEIWVEGAPGKEYRIDIAAPDECQSRISICVDGLDVRSRNICKKKPSYTFSWNITVLGFRLNREMVSAFVFTKASASLAAQFGLRDEIGVIWIGIERDVRCDVIDREGERLLFQHEVLATFGQRGAPVGTHSGLGTGAGRSLHSPVGSGGGRESGSSMGFGHRSVVPYRSFSYHRIRYDTAAGLCRRGINSFCR